MHPHSDETLVEQIRRGSQDAFSQVVERYQGMVYSLCYRMLGSAPEAEDLALEAFMRLHRAAGQFQTGARLRPWLHKITVNVCLDALRRCQDKTLSLDELTEGGYEPPTPPGDQLPEEAYLDREARADVQQALLRLPGEYRAVLVLRYLEGLSYQEVADALGIPLTTVETRIFRAKKALGHILASPTVGGKEEA